MIGRLCAIVLAAAALASPADAMTPLGAISRVFGRNPEARCIAWHESRDNPRAVSPTDDWGLFQINRPTWFGHVIRYHGRAIYVLRRWIRYPLYNAKVAWIISKGGTDFRPWSTYRYCS